MIVSAPTAAGVARTKSNDRTERVHLMLRSTRKGSAKCFRAFAEPNSQRNCGLHGTRRETADFADTRAAKSLHICYEPATETTPCQFPGAEDRRGLPVVGDDCEHLPCESCLTASFSVRARPGRDIARAAP